MSTYIAVSIYNWLQDVSATKAFVNCVQNCFVCSWRRPLWPKCPAISCWLILLRNCSRSIRLLNHTWGLAHQPNTNHLVCTATRPHRLLWQAQLVSTCGTRRAYVIILTFWWLVCTLTWEKQLSVALPSFLEALRSLQQSTRLWCSVAWLGWRKSPLSY